MRLRGSIVLLALVALLLLPATAAAIDRTITVKGEAVQKVVNDAAELGFSVSKERKSKGAALRIVAIRMEAVIAAIKGTVPVAPGELTTGAISVRKLSRGGKPLWRAAESVSVVIHQPERSGEVVSAAVKAGATGTRGPRFFPSHPEAAYNEALLAAFDQAKAKASALASRAGATLGAVLTIEEGREVVPAGSPQSSEGKRGPRGPTPPANPGTSTVTATVRVVFALE